MEGNHRKSSMRQNRNSYGHTGRQVSGKEKSCSLSPRYGNYAGSSSVQQLVLLSSSTTSNILLAAPGYEQYQKSLLEVPLHHTEYGEASSDDLSSEWDSDVPETPKNEPSGWKKLRNIVHWTPFFQTYKKQRYPWVQLAGHQGNFKSGPEPGTILKKLCPKEQLCFQTLMNDPLKPFVPKYKGFITTDDGDQFLQLQDLLSEFSSPCVMDCKIGVRTYLEEELTKAKEKPKLRKDMYEKMIQIDPNAPTGEEHKLKGVTKPRYMVWRETISSTATLGFRIEGIRKSDGKSSKDFKTTKTWEQIMEAIQDFIVGFPHVRDKYIQRLQEIKRTIQGSQFFTTHEVIGSSLLFVHDRNNASIWMIDFAKTLILPNDILINHNTEWVVGNHEDGYLIGLDNLIKIFNEMSKMEAGTRIQIQFADSSFHHLLKKIYGPVPRNVIMSDENKNPKASTAMPASDHLKHNVSLDRRNRPRPISINFKFADNDYGFASISPRSEPSLSPCLSLSSLSHYERAAIPGQPFLTPSLSMWSLQQDDEKSGSKASARRSCPHHSTLTPSFSMSSLVQREYRPRSLMESILIAKMEKANNGGLSLINGYSTPSTKSLLLRTDSLGSTNSFTSNSSLGSDYCRCDDCLLGIVDLNVNLSQQMRLKKPSSWRKLRNILQWTPFFQIYKKQRYPWVQIAGHQENFRAGPEPGTILKKLCPKEQMCFQMLMKDPLKSFVPECKGFIRTDDGELYLQLQDLLSEFSSPCVMDCKIGVRTYLEEELAKAKEKPKLRKDMYEKMIQIDPTSPTDEEQRLKGVTKPRYMIWRETISSTSTLGFRIEGIRKNDGKSSKDFKTTKTRQQIIEALEDFIDGFPNVLEKYIHRLKKIKKTLLMSKFFATHEVIGSSMLFVHDDNNANIWLIDFAKTIILPNDLKISHDKEWMVGNHEDGYLIGLNNLMDVFNDVYKLKSRINNRKTKSIQNEVT